MKTKSTKNIGRNETSRPSLYSFNSRDRDSAEISSILDALEPRRRKSAIWWRSVLIGLVAMLAAALYLVGRDVDVYRQLSPVAGSETAIGRTVVKHEVPGPLPVAASADESSAAAIVVEVPLHHAELQAPDSPGTDKPQVTTATTAAAAPIHAGDIENERGTTAVTGSEPKSISSSTGSGQHPATEAAATPAGKKGGGAMPRAQAGTKAVAPAASGKDSDVDLIAALVSHVSRGDNSGKENRKRSAKATADARAGASARKDRRTDPGHDIVVRNDGDSTETLVKRCRALGLIEGELCRVRICSGLWGIDPACPGAVPSDQLSTSGR